MALSPDGNTLYLADSSAPLLAINLTTRAVKWTYSTATYVDDSGPSVIVDKDGIIYFSTTINSTSALQAITDNGSSATALWSYGILGYSAIGPNNRIYISRFQSFPAELFALTPWTISLSLDSSNYQPGNTVTVTAVSSMLKRDPAASTDNVVQAIMPNGNKVVLSYVSSDGTNTTWRGTWVVPTTTTSGAYTISAEAIAYQTTTNTTTHFDSLAGSFNNTGVTTSQCFGVNSVSPSCGSTAGSGSSIMNTGVTTTDTTASVSWNTADVTDTQLYWGLTSSYGNQVIQNNGNTTNYVTSHSVSLSGLQANTTYHYQIKATNIDRYPLN